MSFAARQELVAMVRSPRVAPASAPGIASPDRLGLQQSELDLLLHGIDAINQHSHPVAKAVGLAGLLPDDLPRILVKGVAVAGEGGQWHQAFDEQVGEL